MNQQAELIQKESKLVELKEWYTKILEYDEKDDYYFNHKKTFLGTLGYDKREDNAILTTRQYVGIIRLPGLKNLLKISPKTALNYMQLLSYAQTVKCNDRKPFFYYDVHQTVDV